MAEIVEKRDLKTAKEIARRLLAIAIDAKRESDSGDDRNLATAISESKRLHQEAFAIVSRYERGSDFYKYAGDPSTLDRYKSLLSDENAQSLWTVDTLELMADTLRYALNAQGMVASPPETPNNALTNR